MTDIIKRGFISLAITLLIVYRSFKKKSLSNNGCIAAFFVGMAVTISSFSHFFALLAFFFSSNKATRYRQDAKKKIDHDFKIGGQRNGWQVFCNGFVPVFFSCVFIYMNGSCAELRWDFANKYAPTLCTCAVLASFSSSCGDTLASELGPVFGQTSINQTHVLHLVTLKKVPKGTNGGVSLYGTIFSILGGFLVGLAYYFPLKLSLISDLKIELVPILIVAVSSSFFGSLIDSVLGGILQYSGVNQKNGTICNEPGRNVKHICGYNILTNNQVNLLSSILVAIPVPYYLNYFGII